MGTQTVAEVDYYAVLGVERAASDDELKAAYRRAVKASHPDHGGTEGLFVLVQEAGQHLLDPGARETYDRGGTTIAVRDDRTPAVVDPWGEDWNDTAPAHSPSRPPSFASPWWQPAPEPVAKTTTTRTKLLRRGNADPWFAASAPPPLEIRAAQALLVVFVIGFVALRWYASSPRPTALIDLLGITWVAIPIFGVIAAIRGLMRIREEPMRFGGVAVALWCLALNLVAVVVAIGGGLAVLRTSI